MRISDWSSDVCSSDLAQLRGRGQGRGAQRKPEVAPQLRAAAGPDPARQVAQQAVQVRAHPLRAARGGDARALRLRAREPEADVVEPRAEGLLHPDQAQLGSGATNEWRRLEDKIGRASCRERVCQYV